MASRIEDAHPWRRRGDRARTAARRLRGALPDADEHRRPAAGRRRLPGLHVLARHNLALLGRHDEAQHCFERLLGLANDVGLLGEEYDPGKRLLGNFPQAFPTCR